MVLYYLFITNEDECNEAIRGVNMIKRVNNSKRLALTEKMIKTIQQY